MEDRVNAEAVQGIPNDTVGLRLVTNPSPSIFGHVGAKGGRFQIYDYIPVTRVESADEKQSLVWDMIL